MALGGGHVTGISLVAVLADRLDAGAPVGAEERTEHLRYEIVELFAVVHCGELFAVGTRRNVLFLRAFPYRAPRRLFVRVATRALLRQITPARAAVEPAPRDQRPVGDYLFPFTSSIGSTRSQSSPTTFNCVICAIFSAAAL